MSTDCYIDSSGCTVCPEIPASSAVAPSVNYSNNLGWNASADSVDALDGDLHVVFTMEQVVGAVCGLRSAASSGQAAPGLFDYAFMFNAFSGSLFVGLYERGASVRSNLNYDSGDTFEIRRQNGVVTYWLNNALLYTSRKRSNGSLIVSCSLYAAGDTIG